MAEEFQESEVIFQEISSDDEHKSATESRRAFPAKKLKLNTDKKNINTVPVNIPARNTPWFRYVDSDLDGGEMVPPHVIVGRRVAGKMMAFSLCAGHGRTLKGRDLSEVRDSILRMTGFLET